MYRKRSRSREAERQASDRRTGSRTPRSRDMPRLRGSRRVRDTSAAAETGSRRPRFRRSIGRRRARRSGRWGRSTSAHTEAFLAPRIALRTPIVAVVRATSNRSRGCRALGHRPCKRSRKACVRRPHRFPKGTSSPPRSQRSQGRANIRAKARELVCAPKAACGLQCTMHSGRRSARLAQCV